MKRHEVYITILIAIIAMLSLSLAYVLLYVEVPVTSYEVNQVRTKVIVPYDSPQLTLKENCDKTSYNYSVYETNRERYYVDGNQVLYGYNIIIQNNENFPGEFKYNKYFRSEYSDFGCIDGQRNVPFYSDRTRWSSVNISGRSNVTVICLLSEKEVHDFETSDPIIEPPEKSNCWFEREVGSKKSLVNVTGYVVIPRYTNKTELKRVFDII